MSSFSRADILNKSIILIGPMCSGKSTIASLLYKKLNMAHISLDNRSQLSFLYEEKDKFRDEKEFDFYLVSYILTSLSEPTVIDFGMKHSIYEDISMFNKLKDLVSDFKSVVLLMPCQDKMKSSSILRERKLTKLGKTSNSLDYFAINSSCNYELATIIQYTNGKSFQRITKEIVEKIKNNENDF